MQNRRRARGLIAFTVVIVTIVGCADDHLPVAEPPPPLTLTLSAPEICETERAKGYAGEERVYNDQGESLGTRNITRWANVAEIRVWWEVTGGTGPYTLVIDGEARDGRGSYRRDRPTGSALVSCALDKQEVSYNDYDEHRWYQPEPRVDSGRKTIRATVTDITGATAEASHQVFVILQLWDNGATIDGEFRLHQLESGKTYRYNDYLFTVPEGITLVTDGGWEGIWGVSIAGTDASLNGKYWNGEEHSRVLGSWIVWPERLPQTNFPTDRSRWISINDPELSEVLTAEQLELNDYLSEFMASKDVLPQLDE